MSTMHSFGGNWTEEKLLCLKKYLQAYSTIFKKNIHASSYNIIYVDAFAGTGCRKIPEKDTALCFPIFEDDDAISLQKGSVQIALENNPLFHKYIFIDKNPEYIEEFTTVRL